MCSLPSFTSSSCLPTRSGSGQLWSSSLLPAGGWVHRRTTAQKNGSDRGKCQVKTRGILHTHSAFRVRGAPLAVAVQEACKPYRSQLCTCIGFTCASFSGKTRSVWGGGATGTLGKGKAGCLLACHEESNREFTAKGSLLQSTSQSARKEDNQSKRIKSYRRKYLHT